MRCSAASGFRVCQQVATTSELNSGYDAALPGAVWPREDRENWQT